VRGDRSWSGRLACLGHDGWPHAGDGLVREGPAFVTGRSGARVSVEGAALQWTGEPCPTCGGSTDTPAASAYSPHAVPTSHPAPLVLAALLVAAVGSRVSGGHRGATAKPPLMRPARRG